MRLIAGLAILVVTALDLRFGHPQTVLHVASLAAGLLLALSFVVDRWLGDPGSAIESTPPPEPEPPAERLEPGSG